jgi:hypothetical protein
MPEKVMAFGKLVDAEGLLLKGQFEEARALFKQVFSELDENDASYRLAAASGLIETLLKICATIPKEEWKPYRLEAVKYIKIALEDYERAPADEQESFRRRHDIENLRNMVASENQMEKKKSGCFIATATYGSPLAPEVLVFRRFRDDILLTSKAGTAFVKFYYLVSPPLARLISKCRILKNLTRRLLLEPALRLLKTVDRF